MGLLGSGLGILGGGLLGALSNKKGPSFSTPNFINNFGVNGVGTATNSGFTPGRSGAFNNALGTAEGSLNPLLQQILNHGSNANTQRFQDAFINARRPQLDTALKQRKQNLNSNIAGQGLGGSSAALFAQGQNARNNNEQLNQLFNQGILGGQALQQQDLQNLIGKFGLSNNLTQQNFNNTLQSALGLGGLLNQNNQSAINRTNALNQIRNAQFNSDKNNSMLSSILSGAIGGAGFGNLLGGKGGFDLGSLFSGGGSGGGGSLTDTLSSAGVSGADLKLLGLG